MSGRLLRMDQHLQVTLASDWFILIAWQEWCFWPGLQLVNLLNKNLLLGLLHVPHLALHDHQWVPRDGHPVRVHHHVLLRLPPCSLLCPFEQHSGDQVVSPLGLEWPFVCPFMVIKVSSGCIFSQKQVLQPRSIKLAPLFWRLLEALKIDLQTKVGWVLKTSGNSLFDRHWNFTIWIKGSWDNWV